jgi:hypothetical protein
VHVELTASGDGRGGRGRFNILHHTPDGLFAHLAGDIDCLNIAGTTALVTGSITEGFDDLGIDPGGERVSLLIDDANPDTVAMDVSFVSGHPIAPCTADPTLAITVDRAGSRHQLNDRPETVCLAENRSDGYVRDARSLNR